MSVLVVDLHVRSAAGEQLEQVFDGRFRPAISAQPGFVGVELLKPTEGDRWVLLIRFTDETARLAWVATDVHQEVWPLIEQHCDGVDPALFEPVP